MKNSNGNEFNNDEQCWLPSSTPTSPIPLIKKREILSRESSLSKEKTKTSITSRSINQWLAKLPEVETQEGQRRAWCDTSSSNDSSNSSSNNASNESSSSNSTNESSFYYDDVLVVSPYALSLSSLRSNGQFSVITGPSEGDGSIQQTGSDTVLNCNEIDTMGYIHDHTLVLPPWFYSVFNSGTKQEDGTVLNKVDVACQTDPTISRCRCYTL